MIFRQPRSLSESFLSLYWMSSILGLAPFSWNTETGKPPKPRFCRVIYSIVIFISVLLWTVIRLVCGVVLQFSSMPITYVITHVLYLGLVSVTAMTALFFSLSNSGSYGVPLIMQKIRHFEELLSLDTDRQLYCKMSLFLVLQILVNILIVVTLHVYELWLWFSSNRNSYDSMSFFVHLVDCVITLQFFNIVRYLRLRFGFINRELVYLQTLEMQDSGFLLNRQFGLNLAIQQQLRYCDENLGGVANKNNLEFARATGSWIDFTEYCRALREAHYRLCDIADDINQRYGFLLLLQTIGMAASIAKGVHASVTTLVSGTGELVLPASWAAFDALRLFLMTFIGDSAEMESTETQQHVQRLQSTIDDIELLRFLQQLLHTKFAFTAFDFFVLNLTLLFGVFGAVTTVTVILLQFQ